MTPSDAIAIGLNPRRLDELIRGHASVEQVADCYAIEVQQVERLMERWGLGHWSGREKSNVRLVREPQ